MQSDSLNGTIESHKDVEEKIHLKFKQLLSATDSAVRTKDREIKKNVVEINELNTRIEELNKRHLEMEAKIISQHQQMDDFIQLRATLDENDLDRTVDSQ